MSVRAGRDYLQQYSRQSAIDALAEMIWNGLDAEADAVDVQIETASMGAPESSLRYVTQITISDNGHGMAADAAESAFTSLGDSWKKGLKGRTINDKRALHGRQGKGRFYAYSLGHRARWTSVATTEGGNQRIEIEGSASKMEGFTISSPVGTSDPTGTVVTIFVEQGRSLTALLRDDVHLQLAGRLAAHLLGNADIAVRVDGRKVDPSALIDGTPREQVLDELPGSVLRGRVAPVLTIVDWSDEMKRAPSLVLCNENKVSLSEVGKPGPKVPLRSTGYLSWSGFGDSAADLMVAELRYEAIVGEAAKVLDNHIQKRLHSATATIISSLKEEGAYPYETREISDPIKRTEREMFDVIAYVARSALEKGSRQQRAMSARLLRLALEERPKSLDEILARTLSLAVEDREVLADMLRYSSLGGIVGAASEVTSRLDLISTLRHVLYSPKVSSEMREVDQLHPLVRDNEWLFGEDWRLSRSEASLTNILRTVVSNEVMLEADLQSVGGQVLLADGRRGRVDLLMQRSIRSPNEQQRLVVELKRPSVKLGNQELGQVRGYASALSKHAGAGPSRWTFLLIGSDCKEEITGQLEQRDRAWGHIESTDKHDIYITTWGRLLDEAEHRLAFYRDQLRYDISQDEAVGRVHERHAEMLPDSLGDSEEDDSAA